MKPYKLQALERRWNVERGSEREKKSIERRDWEWEWEREKRIEPREWEWEWEYKWEREKRVSNRENLG